MKMKPIKYIPGLVLSVMVFSGCLKDEDYDDGMFQAVRSLEAQKNVEIGLTASNTRNFKFYSLGDFMDKDTMLTIIPINLASSEPATEDINVTLKQDDALVTAYNAQNGTQYIVPPSNLFTIVNPGNVVTIPKGSYTGYLSVKVNVKDFTENYALGYSIDKVDKEGYSIPTNFKSGVVGIGANNQWDGDYTVKGYALRAGDDVLTGNFGPVMMSLKSQGSNVVSFRSDDYGDLQVWANLSGVGIGTPYLTINKENNEVTVSSDGGAFNNPAYNSRYDPDTKTFYISFSWGAGPAARLATDTFVYIGPRTWP